jgi:hypothetical protein
MTEEDNVVHLPVQGSEESPAAAAPAERWGTVTEAEMVHQVELAMVWLREHPDSDHLDAAYAIAQRQWGALGQAQWPEFVARVREGAER